jgi:hypothetical protein
MYNQEGFDHNVHEQVGVASSGTRVHALVSPAEAQVLRELLENTKVDLPSRDVNKESLDYRLSLAAGGQEAPLSGQPEFYK